MKNILTIIDENRLTSFESYKRIAEKPMNDYKLRVRDKYYRIVECEFYYGSKRHQDPYVHGHPRQKETIGEWYFHGSGLDITLANGEGYGGILIRGIADVRREAEKPERRDAIIGPLNVCTEIFSQIGNVMADAPIDFGLVDITRDRLGASMKIAKVFAIPRIGLNDSKDNEEKFCRRPYRFISFLHLQHKEADKIKKYLIEESGDLLSIDEYKDYYTGKKW